MERPSARAIRYALVIAIALVAVTVAGALVSSATASPAPHPERTVTGAVQEATPSAKTALVSAPNLRVATGNATPAWVNITSGARIPDNVINPVTAYDPARQAVILFGGQGCHKSSLTSYGCPLGGYFAQATWEFAGGSWTNISNTVGAAAATNPLADQAAMVWDPAIGGLVLWTDWGLSSQFLYSQEYASTWVLGSGSWDNLSLPVPAQPPAIGWMAFDVADNYVLALTPSGAAWEFNGATWTNLDDNLNITLNDWPGAMTWDPTIDKIVLTGAGPDRNDTWTYRDGIWRNVTGDRPGPSDFGNHALPLFYDSQLGGLVDYAGITNASGTPLGETTWLFANDTWSNISGIVGPGPLGANNSMYPTADALPDYELVFDPAYPSNWPTPSLWTLGETPFTYLNEGPALSEVGTPLTIGGGYIGGQPPYTLQFSGLPPGCPAADALPVGCNPTQNGTYTVTLNVTDGAGYTGSAYVSFSVNPALTATFQSGPSPIDLGQWWNLTASPALGAYPYSTGYSGTPPGCVPGGFVLTCRPTAPGTYSVRAQVTDEDGELIAWNGTLVVNPDIELSVALSYSTVETGENLTIAATYGDGTGPLALSWSGLPSGCSAGDGPVISCQPNVSGTYPVRALVTDAVHESATVTETLTVVPRLALLSFAIVPGDYIHQGAGVIFLANVTGGIGGPTYTYTGLPSGCGAANSSFLTCNPAPGAWNVSVRVTDVRGAEGHAFVTLSVAAGKTVPLWEYAAAAAGVAVVVVATAVVLLVRRRRARQAELAAEAEEPGVRVYGK